MRVKAPSFSSKRLFPLACLTAVVVGCGGAVKTNPLPGGGYVVACEKGITACISRAEVVCGDKGYTIVGGISSSKVLGGPNSAYRKVVYEGELSFYCGLYQVPRCSPAGAAVADETQVYQLSAAEPPAAPAAVPVPVPVAPAAPVRVCIPGTTQTCVGSGACSGGQVCTADGLGFGPCDCGTKAPGPAPGAPEPGPAAAAPAGQ